MLLPAQMPLERRDAFMEEATVHQASQQSILFLRCLLDQRDFLLTFFFLKMITLYISVHASKHPLIFWIHASPWFFGSSKVFATILRRPFLQSPSPDVAYMRDGSDGGGPCCTLRSRLWVCQWMGVLDALLSLLLKKPEVMEWQVKHIPFISLMRPSSCPFIRSSIQLSIHLPSQSFICRINQFINVIIRWAYFFKKSKLFLFNSPSILPTSIRLITSIESCRSLDKFLIPHYSTHDEFFLTIPLQSFGPSSPQREGMETIRKGSKWIIEMKKRHSK